MMVGIIFTSTAGSFFNLNSAVGRVLWCVFSVFWQGTTTRQTTFCKEEKRGQKTEKMYHDTCSALTKWVSSLIWKIVTFSNRYQSRKRSTAEFRFNKFGLPILFLTKKWSAPDQVWKSLSCVNSVLNEKFPSLHYPNINLMIWPHTCVILIVIECTIDNWSYDFFSCL